MKRERFDYSLILLLQHFFSSRHLGNWEMDFLLCHVSRLHIPLPAPVGRISLDPRDPIVHARILDTYCLDVRDRFRFFFLARKKKKARGPHGPLRSQSAAAAASEREAQLGKGGLGWLWPRGGGARGRGAAAATSPSTRTERERGGVGADVVDRIMGVDATELSYR